MANCDGNNNNEKHIRFVNNKYVITNGENVIFESDLFNMSSWFHQINDYSVESYELNQDEEQVVDLAGGNFDFVLITIDWPDDIPKNEKMVELFLPDVLTNFNMTIPSFIDDETNFFKIPLKDYFVWDSVIGNEQIKFINISPKKATVNILMAK